MNDKYYILEGHMAVPCDMMAWARWLEKDRKARIVAQTDVAGVHVSTVFLGLDHQYGDGPPLIFETMIFGGKHDQDQWRYTTWKEAETGHSRAVRLARADK